MLTVWGKYCAVAVQVIKLESVDGEVVFDLPGQVAPTSYGGIRIGSEVGSDELAAAARSVTYSFASFGQRFGGAAIGVRPNLLASHRDTIDALRGDLAPLLESQRLVPFSDLGSTGPDLVEFNPSAEGVAAATAAATLTAKGLLSAANALFGDLNGVSLAIEGFGEIGRALAQEGTAMGVSVLGVSTYHGAIGSADGLDVNQLLLAAISSGDRFVREISSQVRPPLDLYRLPVDILVTGARPGGVNRETARGVRAQAVLPVSCAPYTKDGLDILRDKAIVAMPEFVVGAGALVAVQAPKGLRLDELTRRSCRLIVEQIRAAQGAGADFFDFAAASAELFLSTWASADFSPPFAPEPENWFS